MREILNSFFMHLLFVLHDLVNNVISIPLRFIVGDEEVRRISNCDKKKCVRLYL